MHKIDEDVIPSSKQSQDEATRGAFSCNICVLQNFWGICLSSPGSTDMLLPQLAGGGLKHFTLHVQHINFK